MLRPRQLTQSLLTPKLVLFSLLPGKLLPNKSNVPNIRRILIIAFSELSSFFLQSFLGRGLTFAGKLAMTRYTRYGCRTRSICCVEFTGLTRKCILDFLRSWGLNLSTIWHAGPDTYEILDICENGQEVEMLQEKEKYK